MPTDLLTPDEPRPRGDWFSYYAIETGSGRIGIVTCMQCGAAVLIDSDRAVDIHEEWHRRNPDD